MPRITLRDLTAANWEACIRLQPAESQRHFVAPNLYSLAQASVHPDWHPRAIEADETLVGFLLYGLDPDEQTYWIYRLMVGADYQGRGYGRAAMGVALEQLRAIPGCSQVTLSYHPENRVAAKLYASLGFHETGEIIDGEVVARLPLGTAPPAGSVRC